MSAVGLPTPSLPTWPERPRIVLLSSSRDLATPTVNQVRPLLAQHADIVAEDFENATSLDDIEADFVMVFGGDGSILRSAPQMGDRQRPVLGVNLGKLGFLADLAVKELIHVFADVCRGTYPVIHHVMLACSVTRADQTIAQRLCLNEVALLAGPPYSILDIELYVDATWVTTYSCDGLILSTPVGSTAHSLSAGGPILRKDLPAVVLSPISPHTLTMRPVVDSADRHYEMRVHPRMTRHGDDQIAAVVDGSEIARLAGDDVISVTRAMPTFQMIQVSGHGYYKTLREKLGWSGVFARRRKR